MRFKTLAFFICLFGAVMLACSCGGGGGGGGGNGHNEHSQTVAVGLQIRSIDGNIEKAAGRDIKDVLKDAVYYYTAQAAWEGDDALTAQGTQSVPKEFIPGETKFIFASGEWRIDVTVKSANGGQLYTTKRAQDGKVPKTNINVSTKSISVILEKNLAGNGDIGLDIFVPNDGNGGTIIVKYKPVDGGDPIELGPYTEANGGLVLVTDPSDPNYGTLECDHDITDIPAGMYEVVIEYLTDNPGFDPNQPVGPDNPEKIVSGGGAEVVNVFGGEDSDVAIDIIPGEWEGAVFSLTGMHVIDVVVSSNAAGSTAPLGTAVKFTATPKVGIAVEGKSWITYIAPDAYQWYIDGVAVPGETNATFDYTAPSSGYKTVGCRVSKNNEAGNKIEYAAMASIVLSVTPVTP